MFAIFAITWGPVIARQYRQLGHDADFMIDGRDGHVLRTLERAAVVPVRLLNEPVNEVYHFVVGQAERSEVRIQKLRKQLFGARNAVYVGGRLAQVFVGL